MADSSHGNLNQGTTALGLFTEMVKIPSPSGYEQMTANFIKTFVEDLGYRPQQDSAGNLTIDFVGQDTQRPSVFYASHMDEIGFTITAIHPDGTLSARRRGGLLPWKAGEGPVELLSDNHETVTGILSMGSTHTRDANSRTATWASSKIITGQTPEQLAAAGIRIGSPGVIARHVCTPVVFGDMDNPLVGAWTFDDRMGCVVLMRLLAYLAENKIEPAAPTTIAFTTREEVGGLGAAFLAARRQPDVFIAVDGAPMPPNLPLTVTGGPVLWTHDALAIYDSQTNAAIAAAAAKCGVDVQYAAYESGASDASLIVRNGGAARIACFGHPRENSHGFEVARLGVFDEILETIKEIVTSWLP